MPRPGPRTTVRYSQEFKATAVRLSALPGVAVGDVAASLCIHPFTKDMVTQSSLTPKVQHFPIFSRAVVLVPDRFRVEKAVAQNQARWKISGCPGFPVRFYAERIEQGVTGVQPPTDLHGRRIAKLMDLDGVAFSVSGT